MPAKAPQPPPGLQDADDQTRIVIASTPLAVREALRTLFASGPLRVLSDANRSSAEIVIAEALNNIVEHAYARETGEIELTLTYTPSGLYCQIEDHGTVMPGNCLPAGAPNDLKAHNDLPEGGFGWYLIRTLSNDLEYWRIDGRNHLRFRLNTQ
ncbi:MAG: ATP-binding protein [Paracoccaceae bacterium]|nr:ATP-binding protein [Paracoccaceae bacterium]